MNPEQLKNFLQRNYDHQLAQSQSKQARAQESQSQNETKAKQAKPQLCEGTRQILSGKRKTATFEELYKAASVMREKRLAEKRKADEEKSLNEMKGVTFKPQTNKRLSDVKP